MKHLSILIGWTIGATLRLIFTSNIYFYYLNMFIGCNIWMFVEILDLLINRNKKKRIKIS